MPDVKTVRKPMHDVIFGLDLGKVADYSAIVGWERKFVEHPARPRLFLKYYAMTFLHRWELGTSYTEVIDNVCTMCDQYVQTWRAKWRERADQPDHHPLLAVDHTGVGIPVFEFLRKANPKAVLHPILITGGHQATAAADGWHVPKKDLAAALQVCLGTDRIVIGDVEYKQLLTRELNNFKVKVTPAGNEQFGEWREREHDDLVLAAVLGLWLGEKGVPFMAPASMPKDQHVHSIEDRAKARGANWKRKGMFGSREERGRG